MTSRQMSPSLTNPGYARWASGEWQIHWALTGGEEVTGIPGVGLQLQAGPALGSVRTWRNTEKTYFLPWRSGGFWAAA